MKWSSQRKTPDPTWATRRRLWQAAQEVLWLLFAILVVVAALGLLQIAGGWLGGGLDAGGGGRP